MRQCWFAAGDIGTRPRGRLVRSCRSHVHTHLQPSAPRNFRTPCRLQTPPCRMCRSGMRSPTTRLSSRSPARARLSFPFRDPAQHLALGQIILLRTHSRDQFRSVRLSCPQRSSKPSTFCPRLTESIQLAPAISPANTDRRL